MNTLKLSPGKYRHYKGGFYEVIGIATHTETMEELVVYRSLISSSKPEVDPLWVRPLRMFNESIEIDGELRRRFERCE